MYYLDLELHTTNTIFIEEGVSVNVEAENKQRKWFGWCLPI